MSDWKIYYNPRCGTCRKVLEALEREGIRPTVIEYLKTPPSAAEIEKLFSMGAPPEAIVRKKEELYARLGLDRKNLSRPELARILSENPVLIERPVVVKGGRALVVRPPERVAELF